jgi:hypothetical protein
MKMRKGEEVTMRIRKAFFSIAIVAAAGLLLAPVAMAQSALPTSCNADYWTITMEDAPHLVDVSGKYMAVATYRVSGPNPLDHIEGAWAPGLVSVTGPNLTANKVISDPSSGVSYTGDFAGDVTRWAWVVNPQANDVTLTFTTNTNDLTMGLVPFNVTWGKRKSYCAIAGLAGSATTNGLATSREDVTEVLGGKCKVLAHTDPHTGDTTVTLIGPVHNDTQCSPPERIEFGDVQIAITDQSGQQETAPLLFSEGLTFLLGEGTCAYKQYYAPTGPVYRICWTP